MDNKDIAKRLDNIIFCLNKLKIEKAKEISIGLIKEVSNDDQYVFKDEMFFNVDFSNDKYKQEFTIDEIVVRDIYELSEVFRGFRVLSKAYNIHCKPQKIIINSLD